MTGDSSSNCSLTEPMKATPVISPSRTSCSTARRVDADLEAEQVGLGLKAQMRVWSAKPSGC